MSDQLIDSMKQVLADTYALMGQAHICHWNVRGPAFFSLHTASETQYNELFLATDEIAERIRAKGSLAPGGLSTFAKLSGISEISEDVSAEQMVRHLLDANRKTLGDLEVARESAAASGDSQTEDLMIERLQVHQKTAWMLASFLG